MSEEEKEEVLLKTNKCEIVQKKDDRIVAKCEGGSEIDLGMVPQEEIVEQVEEKKAEDCPECAGAIAAGWALSYVKPLDSEKADSLHRQLLDGEITAETALDESQKIAEEHGDATLTDTIGYLKELAKKPLSEIEQMGQGQ